MSRPSTRTALAALVAAAAVTLATFAAHGDGPATAPAAAPDATALQSKLEADGAAFQEAVPSLEVLSDPAARKQASGKAIPAGRQVYADLVALGKADGGHRAETEAGQAQVTALLAIFGDADAVQRQQARADSKDPAVAADGQGDQLFVKWVTTSSDADAHAKVADQVEALAKAHPQSEPLTETLMTMSQVGAGSPAMSARMKALVTGTMKNAKAAEMADAAKGEADTAAKQKSFEGKPLTIAGQLVDGKPFTTADWKGKVVLVDFWATWCGPCRAELPRVEKIYADYHAKGLEILGVSNDQAADDLTKFVKADPKMPWPQLFDSAAAEKGGWNPITTGFGINGIPTMFLIDRKGVLRTVEARESMEDLIPKLLDEK